MCVCACVCASRTGTLPSTGMKKHRTANAKAATIAHSRAFALARPSCLASCSRVMTTLQHTCRCGWGGGDGGRGSTSAKWEPQGFFLAPFPTSIVRNIVPFLTACMHTYMPVPDIDHLFSVGKCVNHPSITAPCSLSLPFAAMTQ